MEHVPTTSRILLHDKWPSMGPHQQMLYVKKVAFIATEMAKLPYSAYRSLQVYILLSTSRICRSFLRGALLWHAITGTVTMERLGSIKRGLLTEGHVCKTTSIITLRDCFRN